MPNNRMVLTETQEDLTTNEDTYILLIYIGESCTGDIDTCNSEYDQSKFLNKTFSAILEPWDKEAKVWQLVTTSYGNY